MYGKVTAQNGIEILYNFLSQQQVSSGPDGLIFAPPPDGTFGKDVFIPERLASWLLDLRLLRHVPLSYLVPDSELLPTESIRFFHVDPSWTDRLIDGVFSAANTGTVDVVFSCELLALARTALDNRLINLAKAQVGNTGWTPAGGITGMLIRSELVRRWPDMIVQANSGANSIPILRAEPVSRDIYIALFAGQPTRVTVREPFTGVRFGVEPTKAPNPLPSQPYEVDARDPAGVEIPVDASPNADTKRVTIPFRNVTRRVIHVANLAANCQAAGNGSQNNSRQVALDLEQRAFVQEFKTSVAEVEGSEELPAGDTLPLRNNKVMNLKSLRALAIQRAKVSL